MAGSIPAELVLVVEQSVEIKASAEKAFAALLEQLGPRNRTPDGVSLNMTIEPWPGGRWFRDLGDREGHLWGHVQVIKRPSVLEICGPLFMSYPAVSHLQFRITEEGGSSRLALRHRAIGLIQEDHRKGVVAGWGMFLEGVKSHVDG
jgi:hypothetical protein